MIRLQAGLDLKKPDWYSGFFTSKTKLVLRFGMELSLTDG